MTFRPIPLIVALALVLTARAAASDIEREARAIEALLVAPCCYSQQVSVHQSPAAADVRRDIRLRLARGETEQEILDAYVARYGRRILAAPPAEGFGVALYVFPIVAFGLSLWLVAHIIRRPSAGREAARSLRGDVSPGTSAARGLNDRLDDELRALD
jgi:cytochrome c-type biogenesis protein CcmH